MAGHCSFRFQKALAFLVLAVPNLAVAEDYESPPVLEAREFAGSIPLAGAQYEVSARVPTDGFMAQITILSPFGEFVASGPGMLSERIDEIRALAALQQLQDDQVFKDAAANTAGDTARNLRRFAAKPMDTLKGVPDGVGRFFERSGRSIRTGFQKIGDVKQGRLPGVDPDRTSNLPGGSGAPVAGPQTNFAETVARAGGDVAVNILGFDKQRRRLAKDLGVDPYTTNRILSEKLDDVTWSAFAGGLGVNVVTSLIPGGLVLSTSSHLSDWVWDTAPGDLRVAIETKLLSMGVSRDNVDLFLRHSFYPLSMQAVLAESLEALDGVDGRADVIPLALSVGSEGQAMFVVQTLDMLRNYHVMREPLAGLSLQGTVVGLTQDGEPAVMAPVDYLSWSATLDGFAVRLQEISDAAPEIQISGSASDRTKQELTKLGWTIEEESPLGPRAYPLQ